MTTCNRCGKVVSNVEWDIHTCTPKPGLCDDCETVSHCLKHGCVPKHQVIKLAHEAGFDCAPDGHIYIDHADGVCDDELERFAALVRADERETLETLYTDANYIFNNPPGEASQEVRDVIEWYASSIRARSNP